MSQIPDRESSAGLTRVRIQSSALHSLPKLPEFCPELVLMNILPILAICFLATDVAFAEAVLIGEFHFGTPGRGLVAGLLQTRNQEEHP